MWDKFLIELYKVLPIILSIVISFLTAYKITLEIKKLKIEIKQLKDKEESKHKKNKRRSFRIKKRLK